MEKELSEALSRQAMELAREWLVKLIENKLKASGIESGGNALVDAIVEHVFSGGGGGDVFEWSGELDGDGPPRQVNLSITAEDMIEFEKIQADFQAKFPTIIETTIIEAANETVRSMKRRWPVDKTYAAADREGFLQRLHHRWGKGFELVRMLETISREVNGTIYQKHLRSRSKKPNYLRQVLIRLHLRACQVTAEVMTLMEGGYADGAMARWRTLHEIAVVAVLLQEWGEDAAHRYLAHEAVEARKEARAYMEHLVPGRSR